MLFVRKRKYLNVFRLNILHFYKQGNKCLRQEILSHAFYVKICLFIHFYLKHCNLTFCLLYIDS